MATAAQQLRDRISFEVNLPVEISLDRDGNPTETQARDGSPEYRYFLYGHRIMWVPQAVHEAIQRADAGEGGSFAITKHRAPKPWTVIHINADEHGMYDAPAPASQPAARPAQTPAPQQQIKCSTPGCQSLAAYNGQNNGQPLCTACAGRIMASQAAQDKPPAPPTVPASIASTHQPYYTALCAAVKIAAEVERYAASINRPLAFDAGDIRAMAATIYIQANGNGGHK